MSNLHFEILKAKINADTVLFGTRADAIASKLTNDVDYKQYNYLNSYDNSSWCGKDCLEECEIHNGEYGYDKKFEIFDILDVFELDNIILIKINHYGDERWACDFALIEK